MRDLLVSFTIAGVVVWATCQGVIWWFRRIGPYTCEVCRREGTARRLESEPELYLCWGCLRKFMRARA